ncbi:2-C-methyl-D-erythritol 4-phosphate cytidylyltransferase [Magnetofaba australis]|uniref:2-C-methyl-D-erythritol 4-phosphate cytidylyltransferase n=1 Tax=Magnetofaba australis IT-1 TaxID=1434232 RepID=A0A1Y2K3F4_9PROT|nr:2-C-methyl-D-erythritol 4-phosphate cytidylyltransferase [Magnetofaba australis]OSM02590.1 putative 2-C-methyl-D-erythritol 4-phosphate cytidylyltransferase [Magnetofaba australis IT-1]
MTNPNTLNSAPHPHAQEAQTAPCAMVLVAAGRGSRFGGEKPKQYQSLMGHPIILKTLRALHRHPLVTDIIPVLAADDPFWPALTEALKQLPKVAKPVIGGAERQDSVRAGLEAARDAGHQWVGIHDAARPGVSTALLDRLFLARAQGDGVIPALPAQDTIKRGDAQGNIVETLDRSQIFLAQTPQVFHLPTILDAHQAAMQAGFFGTDDASLLEWAGKTVKIVEGEMRNLKITRPLDLKIVEYLLGESA